MSKWVMHVEKAGTNPDQRPTQTLIGDTPLPVSVVVGDVFHVTGQPEDVKWRITAIIAPDSDAR